MNILSPKLSVKNCVILADGHRTELDPLSGYCSPLMFPIINKPLIEYCIDFLRKSGIEDIIITFSEESKIPDYLKQNKLSGINIDYYREDRPRGTAGILRDLEKFLGKEPFLVIDSNLFVGQIDLAKFIRFHIEIGSMVTVGVYNDDHSKGNEENVTINNIDKTIKSFHKPYSSIDRRSLWRPSGVYLFNPSVLKFIDQKNYMDIKEQLVPLLQREALRVSAYEIEGFHLCLNSLNDYFNLNRDLLLKGSYMDFNNKEEIEQGVWVGKDVEISPKAYFLGPIVIGNGCEIKDWAQIIGPTVIGNRCRISEGVVIRESIIWDGISLPDSSKVEYSLIGENSNIPDNFHSKNMVVLKGLNIGDVNLISSDYRLKGIINLSNILSIKSSQEKIHKITKRIMDLVLSAAGIILLLPFFLLIAIAIKNDSQGPVFYIQKRCGMKGKFFGMLKFRTMVANAEKLHRELISKKETDGPMFKMSNDPRITRLGRILRGTSIDELPQLFNVLKGEMSLVGPRPLIMEEMKFSSSWRDTRLRMKPGITGLWQIQGRSDTPFHDWIRYDIKYVKDQSLWLDITVLFKTVKVVLKRVGAH